MINSRVLAGILQTIINKAVENLTVPAQNLETILNKKNIKKKCPTKKMTLES